MQTLSYPTCPLSVGMRTRVRVRASWDTQQMLPYNPNAPRKPPKKAPPPPPVALTPSTARLVDSISQLLKRPSQEEVSKPDDSYLGYERWLPSPPKVQKPRSIFNAAALAYLGDGIYELYARRHFLFPPLSIEEYNDRVTAVVRCEAQDALLQKLISDNYLSEHERNVLRWGKNIGSAKNRTKKRAGTAVYNRASSLETLVSSLVPCVFSKFSMNAFNLHSAVTNKLNSIKVNTTPCVYHVEIGFLYLTDAKRLEEVMLKIGFSTDSSMQLISNEVNGTSTSTSTSTGTIVREESTEPRLS
ncbi:hypothetical protein TIFTF001_006468 [Ficus carica]|uniref:RNase III domain-containing protein n=1 Tax=Ficus carica TaxID=3494 RepID=A0AA88D0T8_FICCA|nr:hypothetical protein TIFTF001_006468 [Ficus carica]